MSCAKSAYWLCLPILEQFADLASISNLIIGKLLILSLYDWSQIIDWFCYIYQMTETSKWFNKFKFFPNTFKWRHTIESAVLKFSIGCLLMVYAIDVVVKPGWNRVTKCAILQIYSTFFIYHLRKFSSWVNQVFTSEVHRYKLYHIINKTKKQDWSGNYTVIDRSWAKYIHFCQQDLRWNWVCSTEKYTGFFHWYLHRLSFTYTLILQMWSTYCLRKEHTISKT